MDYQITVGNVCFICDEINQKILFLQRSKQPMKNKYTGVGGKTKFNEDIHLSCIREVKEETDLEVKNIILKGVIKTILEGKNSSWILFVYKATEFVGKLIDSNEGKLQWFGKEECFSLNLIGFIRSILPTILEENKFVEGIIIHDEDGVVLEEKIITSNFFPFDH